jgi:crotonobetainyl-CoA:carnitine CoA-transferase CaiB-like acyl-CoA transferase
MAMPDGVPPVPFAHPGGPLAGYRVLDLADEKGQLCTRLLGELGADVIKVEPREGDPTRGCGPFFRGEEGAETSLFWWVMNAGKRSVTCELRLEQGRELLHRLAARSDILVETCVPGTQAALGLDYPTLRAVNPSLIVVSISGFGQTGPYAKLHTSDIVAAALGGHMHLNGDEEHGPVRTTVPQAFTQANFQAAVGAMVALYARGVNDGVGQHVDVSMQEAMSLAMDNAQTTWDIRGINLGGPGMRRNNTQFTTPRYLYETADGWVACVQAGGLFGVLANTIIDWLAETGEAGPLDSPEWRARLVNPQPLNDDERPIVEDVLAAFCKKRLKDDLVAEAQRRGAGWAPVLSPREIADSRQLAARDYWVRVQHEAIGESFVYPGAPWKFSATPWMQRGRAPHVGEHNDQVYAELLDIGAADLRRLRMRMAV